MPASSSRQERVLRSVLVALAVIVVAATGFRSSAPARAEEERSFTAEVSVLESAGAERSGAGHTHLPAAVARSRCPSVHAALHFYTARWKHWTHLRGATAGLRSPSRLAGCPTYLLHVRQRKAAAEHRRWNRWFEAHLLRDFPVRAERNAWHRAVREAQKVYPGTESWLLSCSASEGGHGRWVPNGDGSGAGGWLQFLSGTFWRMWSSAKGELRSRGYLVPASAESWYSPLGQALAGAWGVTHGRSHEWYGGGCS